MASIYDLKPKFQDLLRPLLVSLHARGVTPNHVTITALIGSFLVGALSLKAADDRIWFLLFPIWLFIRMALNAIDGMLAREFDLRSDLGGVLNEVGDVLSDAVLYLPFAVLLPQAQWAVIFFVFGAVLSEFCGVLGQALGGQRHYEGPMGKSDRAFFIGSIALISYFFPGVIHYWLALFWAAFALTLWTCSNRILSTLRELKHA